MGLSRGLETLAAMRSSFMDWIKRWLVWRSGESFDREPEWFRYVLHEEAEDYLRLGWVFAADLGIYHGQWSVLMRWPCDCKMVEPV